jgi:hypothetical protein
MGGRSKEAKGGKGELHGEIEEDGGLYGQGRLAGVVRWSFQGRKELPLYQNEIRGCRPTKGMEPVCAGHRWPPPVIALRVEGGQE